MTKASPATKVTLRFMATGIAATATYFALTLLLMAPPLRLEPVLASALGCGISILVSYLGHHSYTFERKGRHSFYVTRFIVVTTSLFLLSTLAMYVFTRMIPTDPLYVMFVVTAAYPIASYLLNLLWVFRLR